MLASLTAAQDSSGNAAKPDQVAQDSSSKAATPGQDTQSSSGKAAKPDAAKADQDTQESSSRDTRIDTSPPKDDAQNHPNSAEAVSDLTPPPADNSDVQEFHPWNPYRANKDIQVGDFYFRRKNYKGALERYKDALDYKPGDAVATFRIGECQEKMGNKTDARKYFETYLKILPEGPLAKEARAQLARLDKGQ